MHFHTTKNDLRMGKSVKVNGFGSDVLWNQRLIVDEDGPRG